MSDTVIPVGVFDASAYEKNFIMVWGWVLDGLLDPTKVETAYKTVVETWPILSARLRTNAEAPEKWEYHIPSEFSAARPQYIFKTVVIKGPIRDRHKYPKPSGQITCTVREGSDDDLYSLGGPRSNRDLMKRDIPLVQLQLTLFDDATLVGLTTPHVLCDGPGTKEIIRALSRVLKGETLAPLQPGDPLAHFIDEAKTVEAPPHWRVLNTWNTLRLVKKLLWDFFWDRQIEIRDVFIPSEEIIRIKQEAMDDLKRERGEGDDYWISTSDAIVAYFLKCINGPTTSKTPFSMIYSANIRNHATNVLPKPYLHNAAFPVVTPTLPLCAISEMSLGALAYHIREAIREQVASDAIRRFASWRATNANRNILFCEPSDTWNVASNWRNMEFMDVDFSGGVPDGAEKAIKCVHLWTTSYVPLPISNAMILVGDDPSGGTWMIGRFYKSIWERSDGFGRFTRN